MEEAKKTKDFTHRLIDGQWRVRVTYMLGLVNNKGPYFKSWLQQWGFAADKMADDAADSGTRVHKACEMLAMKKEISVSEFSLSDSEVKKVLGFLNFLKDYNPKIISVEKEVSDGFCSGQNDLELEIKDVKYATDIKSGKGVHDEHYMQISFYAKQLKAVPSILHLKTNTIKGYQFIDLSCIGKEKKDERERWLEGYEKSCELYRIRGFALEPKVEKEIPKTITWEA